MLCQVRNVFLASLIPRPRGASASVGGRRGDHFFSRDQHIVDEWWRREIEEAELRQRIRFDFRLGIRLDSVLRVAHRRPRSRRRPLWAGLHAARGLTQDRRAPNRHAADKIAEIRERHPDALVLVLFGESHLAPRHLPAQVSRADSERRAYSRRSKNVDALYWARWPASHPTTCRRCAVADGVGPASSMPRLWRNTRTTVSILKPLGTRRNGSDRPRAHGVQPHRWF